MKSKKFFGDKAGKPAMEKTGADKKVKIERIVPPADLLPCRLYRAVLSNIIPYCANVPDCENPELTWPEGFVDEAIFAFKATYNGREREVHGYTYMGLEEGTLERDWAEELLGRELQPGEKFDFAQLIGLPCLVVVNLERDSYGCLRNRVIHVKRMPSQN